MLSEYKNLIWGISEKQDGTMKFLGDENDKQVEGNRKNFFSKADINLKNVVSVAAEHDNNIKMVNDSNRGELIYNADGLITNIKNLYLAVTMADCLAILFYDDNKKVIGIAHAGWKGVVKNIVKEVIAKMIGEYNSDSRDISIYVSPRIRECHFGVRDNVAEQFKNYQDCVIKKDNKHFIDLGSIIKKQLLDTGVQDDSIEISEECTYCAGHKYFSHRKNIEDGVYAGNKVLTMIAYIGLI